MMKEIESALREFPSVKDAVLFTRRDGNGDKRTVAYVVPAPGSALASDDLRRFVESHFPEKATPDDFLLVPHLLLKPDGEVDFQALPSPQRTGAKARTGRGFHRTMVEDIVAEIVSAALGQDPSEVDAITFASGDLASREEEVISKIQSTFQIQLPRGSLVKAPTVAGLVRAIETAIREEEGMVPPPLAPALHQGILPLSSTQERFWFLNQLQPDDYAYQLHVATRLRGPLDVAALERSFAGIVRRHQELRTSFPKVDGQPTQTISTDFEVSLPLTDLGYLAEPEREQEALRLAKIEAHRAFDLSRAPAWRTTLLRMTQTDHLLLITVHQIIADRRSVEILSAELQSLYRGFLEGTDPRLPPLPITYTDFALWKQQWLQGAVLERQFAFWRHRLAGAAATLELPADRPRPAVQNPQGASVACDLSPDLVRRLRALGRQEGATLFMTLMASFQALLHRYTGARDVLVGTPVTQRFRSDLQDVIGPFTNTLILRGDLEDNPTFREFVQRIKAATCAACRHQDVPFARLVEALHPDRDLSHAPVFQVMFELAPASPEVVDLFGVNCTPVTEESTAINLDLKFKVVEEGSAHRTIVEYSTDLFDASTITRMLGCWRVLLESVATDADQRISDLSLLTEVERRQLLEEWGGTTVEYRSAPSFLKLFEEEVERQPDAIAVVYENSHLTYRDLNASANQLARHLESLGVGPDVLVALSAERSLDMTVGLLGILKAGGAYVPLGPDYPQERLAFILNDAAPKVVLTQRHLRSKLPPTSARVVCLDDESVAIEAMDPGNAAGGPVPEDLAYVIYTSGSTGQPKGVLITHRSLLNLARTIARRYGLQASDKVLQFSTLNFDIAVEEIFPTWLCGATLVLRDDKAPPAFSNFLRFLTKRRLTVLNLPTAFWHEWVQYLSESEAELPATLRLVIIGGEQASGAAYSRWRAIVGNRIRWLNSYGPTEATVTTTVFSPPHPESTDPIPTPIPIGRPIDNVEVVVLDTHLKLVPIGASGELHVGGAGVARGYLNRPDLTAEKFIPHPFRNDPHFRFYKTGDRVRYLPDGNLQFLGRIDQQVKIRGFRIELGEIEVALGRHPDVADAVVTVWERAPDNKQLVGYAVLRSEANLTANDLRAYLKARLPEYLVPAQIVMLPTFPLTPNGKVDRRALPLPGRETDRVPEGSETARDRLELQLTQIWRDVLGVSRVGIRDSFFDLGGHSLLAVRMFSQIEKLMGKPLPLATLFQAPTIEQLAGILRDDGWQPSKTSLIAIQPKGTKRPFFCVHGGGGGVLVYSDIARHLDTNQPFYGLQSPGFDAECEPLENIVDIASLYLAELRNVQPQGPYFLGGASMGGVVAYEMAQQLSAQGQQVALLALLDTPRPVPISRFRHRVSCLWEPVYHEVFERFVFHRRELGKRTLAEKIDYVCQRVRHPEDEQDVGQSGPAGSLIGLRNVGPARERVHEANSLALAVYAPRPYSGRITLFTASEGEPESFTDPHLGWDGWATEVESHVVPGDHHSMLREPFARTLATRLGKCLERAQGSHASLGTLLLVFTENFGSTARLVQCVLAL